MKRDRKPDAPADPKARRSIRASLFDDERIILVVQPGRLACFPRLLLTLGLYAIWRRADTTVVTNERVLRGKGVFHRSESSIPLSHIDDVTFSRTGMASHVDITVFGADRSVHRIGPLSSRSARRLSKEILRRL